MGASYPDKVQLVQMKVSIPERSIVLIGLSNIRTMMDFWKHMDNEHFDHKALFKAAVSEIKNLDKTDSGFIQMMKVKLSNHSKNLEIHGMGQRITSDEMVREHCLPFLVESAIEIPVRESPLWPEFEAFLETQSDACRERGRLGFETPGGAPTYVCRRCKSAHHDSSDCQESLCLQCKSWNC
jgi:hypothetical protein